MADIIDKANDNYALFFERRMSARRSVFEGPSNTHCEDCDVEIPEARRKLGGVKYCVDCQEYLEKRGLA